MTSIRFSLFLASMLAVPAAILPAQSAADLLNPANLQPMDAKAARPSPALHAYGPAKIDYKGVWLLEASAAKLRHATTLRAVTMSNEYYEKTDTVPPTVTTDTLRYTRGGDIYWGGFVDALHAQAYEVLASTPTSCIRYSWYNPVKKPASQAAPTRAFAALAKPQGDAFNCDQSLAMGPLNPTLHAFMLKKPGRQLSMGEWDIGRLDDPLLHSVTYEGKTKWNGATYDVVQWTYENAATLPEQTTVYTTRMYIDADQIMWRAVTTNDKNARRYDVQVLSLELNAPLTEADFTWTPPAGLKVGDQKPYKEPPSVVGQTMPTFTAPAKLLNGKIVTAADLQKGKKATLYWFWNTSCSSCMGQFPHLEQLYREYKAQGIEIVAVNVVTDPRELSNSREYARYHQSTMPILFVTGDWNDRAQKNPYAIVGPDGKILYDHDDKATLRTMFAKMTAQ